MIHELPGNCEYNIALGGWGGNHNVSVAMIIVYAN